MTSKPLTDDQRAQLKRDMPRDAVKTRSQAGQTLSYVDSVYVIAHAPQCLTRRPLGRCQRHEGDER